MKISVLSYSFRGLLGAGAMDLFGYLETCKFRYHLNAADIWNRMLLSTEDDYLNKVREALAEREMELADIAVDSAHIWEPTAEAREANHRNAIAHLKAAAKLGARFVRIDAGGDREGDHWTNEEFDLIVKRYREYSQFAHDHGFKVGIENHWGPEKYFKNLKAVYQAVNHPGFGVSCHLASWKGTEEEQAKSDEWVAPWVSHTHIAWYLTEGFGSPAAYEAGKALPATRPITGGPLMEKLGNLWKIGYDGYYSVEHHSGKDEYGEVAIQIARVRDTLTKLRLGAQG